MCESLNLGSLYCHRGRLGDPLNLSEMVSLRGFLLQISNPWLLAPLRQQISYTTL